MCCFSWFCDCIYATRCIWFKLYVPSILLDLGLTIYILKQLFDLNAFACCADNLNDNSECSYNRIGGASNVGVDSSGYCININQNLDCNGTLAMCAKDNGVNMTSLCNQTVLNDIATTSVHVFIAILIIKIVGLAFSLLLELKSVCCEKKKPGQAEEEESKNCCKECSAKCCSQLIILLLRIFFLIFGTTITLIALLVLAYSNNVIPSTCSSLSGTLETDCELITSKCTFNNDENYYNIVYPNLNIFGPYWADLASSIVTGIIWFARLSVLRYYSNSTIGDV